MSTEEEVKITLRVTPDVRDTLRHLAQQDRRSMSRQLAHLLEEEKSRRRDYRSQEAQHIA